MADPRHSKADEDRKKGGPKPIDERDIDTQLDQHPEDHRRQEGRKSKADDKKPEKRDA
ncbi:MAG: hypothetical protein QHC90_21040 [Shinella sp.]|nr:hypothetical protein [Shinella sp.]